MRRRPDGSLLLAIVIAAAGLAAWLAALAVLLGSTLEPEQREVLQGLLLPRLPLLALGWLVAVALIAWRRAAVQA